MGADSKIEWTHHTFNPWWGCVRVSAGCENCYAETFSKRVGLKVWGVQAPRRMMSQTYWREPLKWNRAAEKAGERRRVFCASMADVFEDRRDLDDARLMLWWLIEHTPSLDWLLLTKRPENAHGMLPWKVSPRNVWVGTTTENQEQAGKRIPELFKTPAAVRFISYEPAIGRLVLSDSWLRDGWFHCAPTEVAPGLDWVIVGSESGHHARPMELNWARDVVAQCVESGVAVFTKQIATPKHPKGGDPQFWPPGRWPREFPKVRT